MSSKNTFTFSGAQKNPSRLLLRDDGTVGIVDLMLSRSIPQSRADEREHLIVALKRPKKMIDSGVYDQIESYAMAVAAVERFRDTKAAMDLPGPYPTTSRRTSVSGRDSRDKPEGLVLEGPGRAFDRLGQVLGNQALESCPPGGWSSPSGTWNMSRMTSRQSHCWEALLKVSAFRNFRHGFGR